MTIPGPRPKARKQEKPTNKDKPGSNHPSLASHSETIGSNRHVTNLRTRGARHLVFNLKKKKKKKKKCQTAWFTGNFCHWPWCVHKDLPSEKYDHVSVITEAGRSGHSLATTNTDSTCMHA